MNAIQIVGAVFTVLGVVLLGVVVGLALVRVPSGPNLNTARQSALLPAGAGLFLIGLVLMIH